MQRPHPTRNQRRISYWPLSAAAILCLVLIPCGVALAEGPPAIEGQWNFQAIDSWTKGGCRMDKPVNNGVIEISRTGKEYDLVIVSGMTCSPESMCRFKGTFDGQAFVFKNSDTVDKEGGIASNRITLKVVSPKLLKGESRSEYRHPGGYACSWGSNVTLSRP